jgi:diguanylate cyclase (GGDEF)-like protein
MAIAGAVTLGICVLLASLVAKRQSAQLQVLLDGFRAVTCSDAQACLPDEESGGQIGLLYRAFNAMVARVETERAERDARIAAMSRQNVGFQKQHVLLAKLSNTDGLTQLYNHRYFQDQLTREIKRINRTGGRLSMLIIDVDNFKQLNDTHGHAAGDEVLAQLAGILKESIRESDLLARYGGEEFVVVTFGTSAAGAELLAEKLRTRVAESSFMVDESKRPRSVTVSIGVAEFKKSKTELFAAADAALYRAKAAGKNCVVVADDADRKVAAG